MNKKLTILVVVLVIVFGVMYLKSKQDSNISMQQTGDQQEAMTQVSADDSPDTIAQELENTNTDDLGQEFMQIDAEMEAAVSETSQY